MKDENFAGNSKIAIDFLGNKWEYKCMGCAISRREIDVPGGVIYEGKYSILSADPEVPIPGFLVVSAKEHINSFTDLDKDGRYEFIDIIAYAEKALKELNITQEVTIVQEERAKHLHVWIFPNYDWMTQQFGKGIKYLRDISEYAQKNNSQDNINAVLKAIEDIKSYFQEGNFNLE